MNDAKCNNCGGTFTEATDAGTLIAVLECDSCGRQVPRGAFFEQTRFFPGESADELMERAHSEHGPFIAKVCLFSGGNDSTVLAHRMRDHYDSLAFVDTGTAVPGVREFVAEFAEFLDKPLLVYEAGEAFRTMVLGGGVRSDGEEHVALGFPGPGQHNRAYQRLKERQLERMKRDLKEGHPRNSRVLYLTGVRRDESKRRAKRYPLTKQGSTVFVNPLIDWTNSEMLKYRLDNRLPQSDVAALIHRSGECNCGSFAAPGEREMMESLWPDWFERTIGSLEREAEAKGIPHCVWGGPKEREVGQVGEVGPMCSDCQLRIEVEEEAA